MRQVTRHSKKAIEKVWDRIKILAKSKVFYFSLVFLISGMYLNLLSSQYLEKKYGDDLPVLNDLFLDKLPLIRIGWLYDILIFLAIFNFMIYAFLFDTKKVPYFMFAFGISQYLRAAFIILTPFGSPTNGSSNNKILKGPSFENGLYPSGHTGSSFLAFLFSKGVFRTINLILSILVIICLILAKGHYSIDIFSAIIFNYAIYVFSEKHLSKYLTIS